MTRDEYEQYCVDNYLIEILNSIDSLTDKQLAETVEPLKYPKRRYDGQLYSDQMGAKLVLLNAPESVKKIISDFFQLSQSYLCQGWWKSALREMETKTATVYVDQELINEVKTTMSEYINQSY